MHYTKEEDEQYEHENRELFDSLKEMDWELPKDPDEREFSLLLFRELEEESKRSIILSSYAVGKIATTWIEDVAPWEQPYPHLLVRQQREELMSCCYQKAVSSDLVLDVRRRWEQQQFSSVSLEYYVIGDVYTKNRISDSRLKKEVNSILPVARFGSKNLTHDMWGKVTVESIQGIRPKINGERFVHDERNHLLVGFKVLKVPEKFIPKMVEYYAGEYYVIHPIIPQELAYLVEEGMETKRILFHPHPIMTLSDYVAQRERFENHKYDGFMLWFPDGEIKVKWKPSLEAEVDKHVWEISLVGDALHMERPRFGKDFHQYSATTWSASVKAALRSMIPAFHVLQCIVKGPPQVKFVNPILLTGKVHNLGAKCFFLTEDQQLLFIREPDKRLDLIGGMVEAGETPLQAIIRETEEETSCLMMPEQFYYIGATEEEVKNVLWTSHIYVALAPRKMKTAQYVESYQFPCSFSYFNNSSIGKPWQVWLYRHISFFSDYCYNLHELNSLLFVLWDVPIVSDEESPYINEKLMKHVSSTYVRRLREKLRFQNMSRLEAQGYPLPPQIRKELGLDFFVLVKGKESEKKEMWKYVLKDGRERFAIRVFLRELGCQWTDGAIGDTLEKAVKEGILKKDGSYYHVT
jgi:ADP-ribose pyrophosphatase YjhB (NUDIX family)